MRNGVLAEFDSVEGLVDAIREMRAKGYRAMDAYTPFGCKEVEEALELKRSTLPRTMFAWAMIGAGGAYFLQWLTVGYLYPLNVGGRPPQMVPLFLVIVFEMGVLFAALAGFFGVFAYSRLPRLWHPVFEVEGFERASIDRFFLHVFGDDALFSDDTTYQLAALHPLRVVPVPEEPR